MPNILNITDYFLGKFPRSEEPRVFYQAQGLLLTCALLLPIYFVRSLQKVPPGNFTDLLFPIASLILALVPFILRATGDFKHLSFIFVLLLMLIEYLACLATQSIYNSFLFWTPAAIVFVSLMSGMRYGALISLIVSILSISLLKSNAVFGHHLGRQGSFEDFVPLWMLYLFIGELMVLGVLLYFRSAMQKSEDETHKKRILREKTIRKVALTEALGNLAHEVNNPLAIAHASFLRYCKELTGTYGNSRVAEDKLLHGMDSALNRLLNIVSSLRTFTEGDINEPMQDINVPELLALIRQQSYEKALSHGVHLSIVNAASKSLLRCRPQQILFVLSVLLENSFEASDKDPRRVTLTVGSDVQNFRFEVEDNGVGVADDIQDRIFRPFFTTKRLGQSVGMNLSVCLGIIEEHGGEIGFIQKEPGTIFWFELPIGHQL